jgi:hypothetical protein
MARNNISWLLADPLVVPFGVIGYVHTLVLHAYSATDNGDEGFTGARSPCHGDDDADSLDFTATCGTAFV